MRLLLYIFQYLIFVSLICHLVIDILVDVVTLTVSVLAPKCAGSTGDPPNEMTFHPAVKKKS